MKRAADASCGGHFSLVRVLPHRSVFSSVLFTGFACFFLFEHKRMTASKMREGRYHASPPMSSHPPEDPSPEIETISARLRSLRAAIPSRPSQEVVAIAVGVSQNAVSKWERAESAPGVIEVGKLADYFSRALGSVVSVDYIIGRSHYMPGYAPDTWLADIDLIEAIRKNPKTLGVPAWKAPRRLRILTLDEMRQLQRELGSEGLGA